MTCWAASLIAFAVGIVVGVGGLYLFLMKED
jgi:hypothetical protein